MFNKKYKKLLARLMNAENYIYKLRNTLNNEQTVNGAFHIFLTEVLKSKERDEINIVDKTIQEMLLNITKQYYLS